MALPKENVYKAKEILAAVAGFKKPITGNFNKDDPYETGKILLYDRKYDGGWENVILNVHNITPAQLELFNKRKSEVRGNTSFVSKYPDGITRIGWI